MRRILLPPVLPALFTAAGTVLHRGAWRVEPLPAPWPVAAGGILMVTALGLAVSAFLVFRRHDESLDLRKPTRRLVSAGPYRISRNPVYLAFVVFIAGLGCADNAAAVLLAVAPPSRPSTGTPFPTRRPTSAARWGPRTTDTRRGSDAGSDAPSASTRDHRHRWIRQPRIRKLASSCSAKRRTDS